MKGEMKHYLDLASISVSVRRKQSRMTVSYTHLTLPTILRV